MALYVKLNKDEIEAFIADYNLKLIDFKGIIEGVQNTNYFLLTTSGKYILTVCEEEINPTDLPFFNSAMLYAALHGVPCPVPLKNKYGAFTGRLKNKPAGIVTFLEGKSVTDITFSHLENLGRFLGKLHIQTKDFKEERANPLCLDNVTELIRKNKKIDNISPNLSAEINKELNLVSEELKSFYNLPKGFVHADIFPDNMFFEGNNVSGIIDFYFCCSDYLAYDLAVTANAWCFDNKGFDYNEKKIKILLDSYQKIRPLEQAEKYAFNALLRRAALRFFATRAWDMKYPKPNAVVGVKDPMEYVAKLRAFKSAGDLFK
ncbi:Homoserine kinase [Elusimicrobium minutum Pei191]|uniref:Homoserine kinase n=1 Tax=Elusimicrobium minutum (strain Pei191) TaxID=445932 RepID=B2KD17_ELUMP|nr:homoserine kinase [Elusimicrobium minutum]ACC98413.1 Homoserine kinase [Elusimicrobium minutum Pei191]